ncbi:V-type proton ATPase subunit H-like isoform X2 [Uloborus diversus]|uniref:V-type proton ATPase subunit H-like isoform X2 n=1 Tax=Uloborus diversus TaxID=327109 RepID=UPI00240A4C43|nr:V-type proton ATPase subunit H-like isoform X2 [Uloborus diversus]
MADTNDDDSSQSSSILDATGTLQQRANEIRSHMVNWMSYRQSNMITQDDYNFIIAFDKARDKKSRDAILEAQGHQCSKTFLSLLGHISKDQTLQYILIMIDDMLQEDKSRVELFKPTKHTKKKSDSIWSPFLTLLTRPDGFIMNMTSRIIAKLACWSKELMDGADLNLYLSWLKDQLRQPNNEYIQSVARCLQMMLRIDEYRLAFVTVDGISKLVTVLAGKGNYQIQYQLIFCIWVMTFNETLAERMHKFNVIPILSDILSECPKEKVTRIILATLRNLIEKPEELSISRDNAIAMVQCKVLKQLDILQSRRFDDPDIVEDLEFLNEKLQTSVQDLSSFDEYSTEIKSGRLEWSPVHNSEKFWRENTHRLNEKNYELLKILICLLENSKDPLVLSVAAHDIGEYVRHYPRGKHVIEGLGGKQQVMHLLSHEDPNVRYQALLCVQKLMVHNWTSLCLKCSGLRLDARIKSPDCSNGNCFFKTDFATK